VQIGIQELRSNLSRYLADVARGGTITITRRGKPIARLEGIAQPSTLERLVAEGRVRLPGQPRRPAPAPIRVEGTVSELVAEQRR
jgi:prevent-host-death family protein